MVNILTGEVKLVSPVGYGLRLAVDHMALLLQAKGKVWHTVHNKRGLLYQLSPALTTACALDADLRTGLAPGC
jgi:hypothetical protein